MTIRIEIGFSLSWQSSLNNLVPSALMQCRDCQFGSSARSSGRLPAIAARAMATRCCPASRQLVGDVFHSIAKIYSSQSGFRTLFAGFFGRYSTEDFQSHGNIVECTEMVKKMEILENPTYQVASDIDNRGQVLQPVNSRIEFDFTLVCW